MENVFILLVVFQIKHFLCDYIGQGEYMLGKFKPSPAYILPLLTHVAVHGLATMLISFIYIYNNSAHYGLFVSDLSFFVNFVMIASLFAALDMVLHFIMDRIKASPDMLGRYKSLNAIEYRQAKWQSMGLSIVEGRPRKHIYSDKEHELYRSQGINNLKSNKYFWWSLGLDQSVHHLSHYLIIYLMLR